MRALPRVCATYFTAFPLQRWPVSIGLLLGLVPMWMLSMPIEGYLCTFLFIYILMVSVVTGTVFAVLSAPHRHALLPNFRTTMLTSVAVILVLVLGVWQVLVWSVGAHHVLQSSLAGNLIYPACTLTFAMIGPWLMMSMVRYTWLLILPVLALWTLPLLINASPSIVAFHGYATGVMCFGVWTASSLLYLRQRPIPKRSSSIEVLPAKGVYATGPLRFENAIDLDAAIGWVLAGRGGADIGKLMRRFVIYTFIVFGGFLFQSMISPDAATIWLVLPLDVAAFVWLFVNRAARRSRLLWLKHGNLRTDLLHRCEREFLRRPMIVIGLGLAIWYAGIAVGFGVGFRVVVTSLLLAVAGAGLGFYLALAGVRGIRLLELAVSTMAFASVVCAMGLVVLDQGDTWPALLLATIEIALAGICRNVAYRRWRQIDWLTFRPVERVGFG